MAVRILALGDTHLGIDLPRKPRIRRRRRGEDFFANFETALEPALRREVDFVVHLGDLLFRSKVPASLFDAAMAPLKRVADAGVPVILVAGNHERSKMPYPLLAIHPDIHVFDHPRSVVLDAKGVKVCFTGFQHVREGVRDRFTELIAETGALCLNADVRLLCVHECFEGARVGAHDFIFRSSKETVRASDLPKGFAGFLSGHIHRHQVLTTDLRGGKLPAPVYYPGSIERTSFAERDEAKGYLLLECEPGGQGGAVSSWDFRKLPARPMLVEELRAGQGAAALSRGIIEAVSRAPADAILRLRVTGDLAEGEAELLRAGRLRSIAPPTMNVDVRVVDNAV